MDVQRKKFCALKLGKMHTKSEKKTSFFCHFVLIKIEANAYITSNSSVV